MSCVFILSGYCQYTPEDTKAMVKKRDISWPVLYNTQKVPYDIYGFTGIPHLMLIGHPSHIGEGHAVPVIEYRFTYQCIKRSFIVVLPREILRSVCASPRRHGPGPQVYRFQGRDCDRRHAEFLIARDYIVRVLSIAGPGYSTGFSVRNRLSRRASIMAGLSPREMPFLPHGGSGGGAYPS